MPAPRIGRIGDGGPRDWLEALPPITRLWFLASFSTTVLVQFGMLSPGRILWSFQALKSFELWRLVTPYLFFGGFSFPFLISMYFLVAYSKNYEVSPYNTGGGGSTSDYAWMLGIGVLVMNALCTYFGISMPASGLTTMVLYVWSRKNPASQVSMYGIPMPAVWLPWAILALNIVIGNDIFVLAIGIVVGHIYYFAVEVVPATYGTTVVRTPLFVCDLFGDSPRGGGPAAAPRPGGQAAPAPVANRGRGYNWGTGRALGAN